MTAALASGAISPVLILRGSSETMIASQQTGGKRRKISHLALLAAGTALAAQRAKKHLALSSDSSTPTI
jgi:hypothetical protein